MMPEFLAQLVTCGVGTGKPCTICDIWVLADNVVDFLLQTLAAPILVIVLVIGGFIYLTSGGNPKKTEQAKSLLTSAIVGIVIALAAWLIVNTILNVLVKKEFVPPWTDIKGSDCPLPLEPTPVDLSNLPKPPGPIITTPFSNEYFAQRLFSIASAGADCKNTQGVLVSAKTTLQEIAEKKPLTVCSSGCKNQNGCAPKTNVAISTKLLQVLNTAKNSYSFTITSITTGDHSSLSCHYGGNCVDVVPQVKDDYPALRQQFQALGATAFCETKSGKQAVCATAGVSDQADPIDHIHASF